MYEGKKRERNIVFWEKFFFNIKVFVGSFVRLFMNVYFVLFVEKKFLEGRILL